MCLCADLSDGADGEVVRAGLCRGGERHDELLPEQPLHLGTQLDTIDIKDTHTFI